MTGSPPGIQGPAPARIWSRVALFAVALGLRLFFFTGFVGSDDSGYLAVAKGIAEHGDWVTHDLGSSRVMFVGAIASGIRLFGYGELATVAVPLVASLLTHLAVYGVAAIYFGQTAALVAVYLLAFNPLNLTLSTILVPEPLLSLLLATGLFAYLLAERAGRVGGALGSLSAGMLVGLAYLVKEPAALAMAAFGLVWAFTALRERRIRAIWIGVCAGFLLVLLGELVFRYVTTGNALQRYLIVSGGVSTAMRESEAARRLAP